MKQNGTQNRCIAKTKNGKSCRAAATAGGLCFFHANPKRAAELGRIGGSKNRRVAVAEAQPLPLLNSAVSIQAAIGQLIADVHSGKLHPRIAAAIAPLVNLLIRVRTTVELEGRIDELLDILDKQGKTSSTESYAGASTVWKGLA